MLLSTTLFIDAMNKINLSRSTRLYLKDKDFILNSPFNIFLL